MRPHSSLYITQQKLHITKIIKTSIDLRFLKVLYSTLLHLPPLKFHYVGGWYDLTQDCCKVCIVSQRINHLARSHLLLESFIGSGQEVFSILQFSSTFPGNFFTKLKTAHLAEWRGYINVLILPTPPPPPVWQLVRSVGKG